MTSSASPSPLFNLLRWLATHTRFPASRLGERAELLLLLSVAAADEEAAATAAANGRGPLQRRDAAKDSAMRAHAMRRSLVHFRCDNSAKV